MNPYLTDEVDIITVTKDLNNVETETVQQNVPARVSERHRLVINSKGEEVFGSMQVMFDTGVSITYESRIVVKKLCGVTYSMLTKKWQVHSISDGRTFNARFVEVWV